MHTPSHYRTKKKELDMKKDLQKARVITSQAESPAIKTVLLRTALCVAAGQGDQSPVLKLHSTVSHANDTSTSFLLSFHSLLLYQRLRLFQIPKLLWFCFIRCECWITRWQNCLFLRSILSKLSVQSPICKSAQAALPEDSRCSPSSLKEYSQLFPLQKWKF